MIVLRIAAVKLGVFGEVAEIREADPLARIADDAVRERNVDRVEERIGDETEHQDQRGEASTSPNSVCRPEHERRELGIASDSVGDSVDPPSCPPGSAFRRRPICNDRNQAIGCLHQYVPTGADSPRW